MMLGRGYVKLTEEDLICGATIQYCITFLFIQTINGVQKNCTINHSIVISFSYIRAFCVCIEDAAVFFFSFLFYFF